MKMFNMYLLAVFLALLSQCYSQRPPGAGESGLPPLRLSHKPLCAEHKVVSYVRCGCYRTFRNRLLSHESKRQCRETFRSQLRVMKTACPKKPILPLLYKILQDCFKPASGTPSELIFVEDHAEVAIVRAIAKKVYKLLRKQAFDCDLAPLDKERLIFGIDDDLKNEQSQLDTNIPQVEDPYAGWMGSRNWLHGGREVM